MPADRDLAELAAGEWRRRQARAARKVASGEIGAGEATALLRPWLALACRCGADLPELDDPLADYREALCGAADSARAQVAAGGSADRNRAENERLIRAATADFICSLPQVRQALAGARESALRRSEADPGDTAKLSRARALCTLAVHFGVPMATRSPEPLEAAA